MKLSHFVIIGLLSNLASQAHAVAQSRDVVASVAGAVKDDASAAKDDDEWGEPSKPAVQPLKKAVPPAVAPAPAPTTTVPAPAATTPLPSTEPAGQTAPDLDATEPAGKPDVEAKTPVAPATAPTVKKAVPAPVKKPAAAQIPAASPVQQTTTRDTKNVNAPAVDTSLSSTPEAPKPTPVKSMRAAAPVAQPVTPAQGPVPAQAATPTTAAPALDSEADDGFGDSSATTVRDTTRAKVTDDLKNKNKARLRPSDVGLSSDQTKAILEIRKKAQSEAEKRLSDELKTAKLDMNASMVDATPADEVRRKFELVQKKYLELQRIKFERTLKIREVLSVEQRKKLQGIKSSH